ncbi:MAG: APC family permease [Candidatus Dojkabacteria bacterium]
MEEVKHGKKLGQFFSTALSGNDILSSSLYVSGIAAIFSGVYAPLVLLIVGLVLFFYKNVYREVVEALPINGGAYNVLLNGTAKPLAALAGVMTILSYVATAVISSKTAVEYLFKFLEKIFANGESGPQLGVLIIPFIILILLGFAILVISGVKDSAKVASAIFIFHIITLASFIIFGLIFLFTNSQVLNLNILDTAPLVQNNGGLFPTIVLAFSASLLGVSGFESSANFVEEQKKGVFKKTLRNMLIGVMIFNPLIAMVVLNILPIGSIIVAKDFLLAEAAFKLGGIVLLGWIAIDAFLVLCGAVLTSYVGVSGLMNRMALDDCLPNFLSKENSRGSHPRIIILFFLLCTSILLVTRGDLLSLAGVYTISFLGVMTLFALGNLILRRTRSELKRPYKAPLFFVIAAFISTTIGLIGNSVIDLKNDAYFLFYFIPAITIVFSIIYRKELLKVVLPLFKNNRTIYNWISDRYFESIRTSYYVFVHNTSRLYSILEYINRNENGSHVLIIACKDKDNSAEMSKVKKILPCLKEAGVLPHLNIEYTYIDKEFGPDVVDEVAKTYKINKNKIFIGALHHHNDFNYDELGGVRIVF